jgi:glucose/arabinose dehydrogenase
VVSLAGIILIAAGATGCSEEEPTSAPSPASSTARTPGPETTSREENASGESASKAPKLPDGHVLAQAENRLGNSTLPVEKLVAGDPLAVMVTCQGKGTLTVSLTPQDITFPLECAEGKASTTYNQIDLKRDRDSSSIKVAAPSTVRWSLTAGQ